MGSLRGMRKGSILSLSENTIGVGIFSCTDNHELESEWDHLGEWEKAQVNHCLKMQ
jgi:hypothetical protein